MCFDLLCKSACANSSLYLGFIENKVVLSLGREDTFNYDICKVVLFKVALLAILSF